MKKTVIFVMLTFLSFCNTLNLVIQKNSPSVLFAGARIINQNSKSIDLQFEIIIANRLGLKVPINEINYSIKIQDTILHQGKVTPLTALNPNERRNIIVTKNILYSQFNDINKPTVTISGVAIFSAPSISKLSMGSSSASFKGSYDIVLPGNPQIAAKSFAVTSVDFLGANVKIGFEINNDSPVTVTYSNFAYKIISGAGSTVLVSSDKSTKVIIKAKSKMEFIVTSRVNFIPLISNVTEFFKKKSISLALEAKAKVTSASNKTSVLKFQSGMQLILPVFPQITAGKVKVLNVDFFGADVAFDINIANNSNRKLHFGKLAYSFNATTTKLFSGSFNERIIVAKKSKKTFTLKQRIDFFAITNNVLGLIEKKQPIQFSVQASLKDFLGKFKDFKIDLSGIGNISLPALPKVSFVSFTFVKANLNPFNASALFSLKFKVQNPNKFKFTMKQMRYNFFAEGNKLLEATAQKISLESLSSKVLDVPVRLKGRHLISLVPKLKNIQKIKWALNGLTTIMAGGKTITAAFNIN